MTFKPTRRDFLAGGVGAGASLPLLKGLAPRWMQAAVAPWKKLVVVQLNGGNDWINNIVDPDEPTYLAARPLIGMPKAKMVPLAGSLYLHPALAPFKTLYDAGELAVLPGIGYPNPNYSHFRSMDIWAAADPLAATLRQGWLGSFLSKLYTGGSAIEALDLESQLNRMFVSHPVPVLLPQSLASFTFRVDSYTSVDSQVETALIESNAKVLRPTAHPNLKFLADAIAGVPAVSNVLQTTGASYQPKVTYPTATARDRALTPLLQLVARYISGGLDTPLYFTTLGGFDTHANQVQSADNTTGTHADLLGAVAGCIKAFLDDLKAWGAADDVAVVVWSEFGRRVGENGNLGCDHGAAGVAYVAGKPVKGGVKSAYPSWSTATTPYNRANFQYTVDFRSLYATILDDYWLVDSTQVLGQKWPSLGLF